MSVGLGIRRPIKEKQFKVERNKKRKLQFIIDLIIYIYKCKTNVFCQCSASRDVLLSRLLIFIVSCKCAVAICINDYMLRSHPKKNSISFYFTTFTRRKIIFLLLSTKHIYTNIDGRRRASTCLPLDKTKKGNKLPRKIPNYRNKLPRLSLKYGVEGHLALSVVMALTLVLFGFLVS